MLVRSKCIRCGEIKELTKHSLSGHHMHPFVRLCRECHNHVDGCDGNHGIRRNQMVKGKCPVCNSTRFRDLIFNGKVMGKKCLKCPFETHLNLDTEKLNTKNALN